MNGLSQDKLSKT
jgi:hypothetical protein